MTQITLKKAQWLWQDYVGAKWQNLAWGNTGDDHASYVYPQGKKSSNAYRPKSLFYHYQKKIDGNKYKLNSVKFVLVIGKFNTKSNDLPTVKIFSGDNNAPYKKSPIKIIKSYKQLNNYFSFDSHTLEYDLTGISVNDLEDIIIEVDWNKTKINSSSTISVNRARLVINYDLKTPKFSTYDSIDKNYLYNDEILTYKLTTKNSQYKGTGSTTIKFPKGCSIVSHTGGGTWNNSNKTLSYTLDKGKSITHTFKLKFSNVGMQYIKTENNGLYVSNLNTIQQVSVVKRQIVPEIVIDDTPKQRDDIITYNFYTSFAKEPSYFDVNIQGFKENHPYGLACFTLQVPNNVVLDEPIRLSTELLDENINIDSIIRDESFEKHGISVQVDDDTVCLNLDNDDEDFVVNLRFPIYCTNDDDALIKINNKYEDTLFINPVKKSIFDFVPTISRDKKYVQNSVNIGSAGMWTIRAKSSKRNFFDIKKELLAINIEKFNAYIGCIPLTRGHQVGDEASVKNTLIENRHNNRAYYGKKGDFSEDIGMTLRLHPSDVATLEGLCELDKPIPIDTVPHIPDGDPLNHRGWAELHGVSGIKKINSFLYECKPEVTYLTHDLVTRFGIDEGAKIASNSIEYFLGLTHDFGDNIKDFFNVSYNQFFNNVEDENGDYIGEYNIESDTNLKFNSLNKLSNRGNYDLKFRNILPALMSEDYDGNWSMAIRILNKLDKKPLFEHLYDNFKHYDFNNGIVLNECDVTSRVLNGDNYEIINYDKLSLTYGGLASLTELNKKGCYFNKIERDTYDVENNIVETFLYDKDDNPIINGDVKVILTNNEGYYDDFRILSDINGKVEFPLNLNNGRYNIKFVFNENETYKGCEYTVSILINYETEEYHFEYPSNDFIVNTKNINYPIKLLDSNDNAVNGVIIYYSFKGLDDTNYSYEGKTLTNSRGEANIPINFTNGSKYLKVSFKGFIDNGVVYPSCYFEDLININIEGEDTIIEADDVKLTHGDNNKIYNIILKDSNNNVLINKDVTIAFYNDKENYVFNITTNNFGVANIPIYLGVGNWFVDIHFKGDSIYKPNIVTKNIIIENFVKHDVNITSKNLLLNENKLINDEQDFYEITLTDEEDNYIINEPVNIKVWDSSKSNKYVDTIMYTNNFGTIVFPYITHNENVIIESYYEGSNKYDIGFNSDVVNFENIPNKYDTDFVATSSNINVIQNGVTNDLVRGVTEGEFDVIVTDENNNRLSNEGIFFAASCEPNHTYYVTILHRGTNTYYAKCKTLTYTPTGGVGKATFNWWLMQQDVDTAKWDLVSEGSTTKGEMFKFRFNCNFTHGYTPIYLGVGCDLHGNTNLEELTNNSIYVLKSKPIKYIDNDEYVEYIEFTGVIPNDSSITSSDAKFFLYCPENLHHYGYGQHLYDVDDLHINDTTKTKNSVIEQEGFGLHNETRQNIYVTSSSNETTDLTKNTNDYYIMKLFNNHTYEELFFYSYLDDIVTSQNIKFVLSMDNWDLTLMGSGNDTYNGDYYMLNNVTINVESDPEEPSIIDGIHNTIEVDNDLFFNEYNYTINIGDSINIDTTNKSVNVPNNTQAYINNNILPDYDYSLKFKFEDSSNLGNFVFDYDGVSNVISGTTVENGITTVWTNQSIGRMLLYRKNGQMLKSYRIGNVNNFYVEFKIHNNLCDVYINDELAFSDCEISYNNICFANDCYISEIKLSEYNKIINSFTENVDEYEGKTFGSDVYFEMKNNKMNFVDYGMLPEGDNGTGKIILNDINLLDTDYELEIEIKYDNKSFQRLYDLNGYLKFRSYEDVSLSNNLKYSNILCSPTPVNNSITRFTRHTDEGTMYFVETPLVDNKKVRPTYLCNPYIQYKGGTELNSVNGISLFNLDNGFSPVTLDNGLVKCEFHRRSGYIVLYRYDDVSDIWYKCNTLKLADNPQLKLYKYTDDMCEIHFGETIWKMWRGRPFIQVKHSNDDFRILNLVDRVYCETIENENDMGFVEEHNTYMSTFNPKTSIQLFKEEWNIGQNIRLDNFKTFSLTKSGDYYYVNDTLDNMELIDDNSVKAIKINKSTTAPMALNFPASPTYVKKPNSTFTLLLNDLKTYNIDTVIVKCRGFDEKGCIHSVDNIDYGIWEQSKTVNIESCLGVLNGSLSNDDSSTCEDYLMKDGSKTEEYSDEIRVIFTDCPDEVKYIDFLIIFPNYTDNIIVKNIMLYEGDVDNTISYREDNSKANASKIEVKFNETYYANLYDDDAPCGLCIVRPYKESFTLRNLSKAKETVLIPYMKKCSEWDKPENVFIEYFNTNEQIINIDWEN